MAAGRLFSSAGPAGRLVFTFVVWLSISGAIAAEVSSVSAVVRGRKSHATRLDDVGINSSSIEVDGMNIEGIGGCDGGGMRMLMVPVSSKNVQLLAHPRGPGKPASWLWENLLYKAKLTKLERATEKVEYVTGEWRLLASAVCSHNIWVGMSEVTSSGKK